jgi:hypothetical protein
MRNILIAAFIILASVVLYWALSQSDPAQNPETQTYRATPSVQESASNPADAIVRTEKEGERPSTKNEWDPGPEVLVLLQSSFEEYHGPGGGEERIIEYQRGKLEGRSGEILQDRLSSFPERFQNSGLLFEASLVEMDGMLRVAGNHLSNALNHQLDRYSQWQQEGRGDLKRLPADAMRAYPLDYPPEMWLALLTGEPAASASAELLFEMALLRDRLLRQDALLYQEQYILDSSMTVVAQRLREEIPAEQWPKVWSQLVPQYGKVLQEQNHLGQEYMNGLQALAAGK